MRTYIPFSTPNSNFFVYLTYNLTWHVTLWRAHGSLMRTNNGKNNKRERERETHVLKTNPSFLNFKVTDVHAGYQSVYD